MIERHEQTNAAHQSQSGRIFWLWWIPISIIVGVVSTYLALLILVPLVGETYYVEVRDLESGCIAAIILLGICLPIFLPRPIWKQIGSILTVWIVTFVAATCGWSLILMQEGFISESSVFSRSGGWIAGWLIGSLILGIAWYWRRRATTSRK